MPLRPGCTGAKRWPLIRETLPYAAAIAVNTHLLPRDDRGDVADRRGEQTGYFATSFRVTEVLVGIPALAVGAGFPILSRAAREDSERFKATSGPLELALIAGAGMVLVVVLSAPFVIRVLAGPGGAPAAPVLQIQGLALVATFVVAATGFALLSLRRHTELLIANGGALLRTWSLTLALVPLDQARGAAVAAGIAETCLALGLRSSCSAHRIGIPVDALGRRSRSRSRGRRPAACRTCTRSFARPPGVTIYVTVLAALRAGSRPRSPTLLPRRQPP